MYRTTTKTPIGETLFRLVYGSEAVIPTKVRLTSYKLENQNKSRNDKAIRLQLDLVDEVKAIAEHSLARNQNLMAKHYNSRVKRRDFQVGDLVLRKVTGAKKKSIPRKVKTQLGRSLQDYLMAEERHLSLGDTQRTEVASSVEH